MWLVLHEVGDDSATWIGRGLRKRGLVPFVQLEASVLGDVVRWEHRLGRQGDSFRLQLADGRILDGAAIRGVVNRLRSIPLGPLARIVESDRMYAVQEISAFYLSWLNALPGVVLNRPTPRGLSGTWRPASEWAWLARQAGLAISDFRLCTRPAPAQTAGDVPKPDGSRFRTIFVVVGAVIGRAPAGVVAGCARLAKSADTEVLGVEFAVGPAGTWTFARASEHTDLRPGGDPLLDALAASLRGRGGEP